MHASTLRPGLPMLHRLWRGLPVRPRRAALVCALAALAPRPDRPPPAPRTGIAVAGELSRASGLGAGARLMLAALASLGVPAWALDVGPPIPGSGGGGPPRSPPAAAPAAGAALVLHVNAPMLPLALLRLPRGFLRGRRVVGYWAWELPVAPTDWGPGARHVHQAWVPSAFTAAALESVLPGRVRIVPHPLAADPPVPAAFDRAAFGLPAAAVVVLVSFNLASSCERKNPFGAIAAFRAAFGTRPDRILLLKIGHPGDFAADFDRLRAAVAGQANIRLETRTLPAADSHALTRAADIVLSLHRSEGFGLVPAEAMLLGRPVIATGWSGNMQYMDDACAALTGYRLVPARDPRAVFQAPGALWAEPDQADAVAHLRRLADDAQARAALGGRGRVAATERLGSEPLRAALAELGLRAGVAPGPGVAVNGIA